MLAFTLHLEWPGSEHIGFGFRTRFGRRRLSATVERRRRLSGSGVEFIGEKVDAEQGGGFRALRMDENI
jgi:hypothetical protein